MKPLRLRKIANAVGWFLAFLGVTFVVWTSDPITLVIGVGVILWTLAPMFRGRDE